MPLIQIAQPAVGPVSVAEVLDAAGMDVAEFNAQATIAINALREDLEKKTKLAFITQTKELVLDSFPKKEIDLDQGNVQNIVFVKYLDPDGVEQTLSNDRYMLDNVSKPKNWLLPAYGTSWPEIFGTVNSLRIRFIVGYGDTAADVPESIRQWIIVNAVQMLSNPDGLAQQTLSPLPIFDRLIDTYIVHQAF